MHERSFFFMFESVLLLLYNAAQADEPLILSTPRCCCGELDSDIFPLATVNYLDGNLLSLHIYLLFLCANTFCLVELVQYNGSNMQRISTLLMEVRLFVIGIVTK